MYVAKDTSNIEFFDGWTEWSGCCRCIICSAYLLAYLLTYDICTCINTQSSAFPLKGWQEGGNMR